MHHASTLLPAMLGAAQKHAAGHWNAVVEGLAQNLLKMFMDYDPQLFDRCSQDVKRGDAQRERQR
jgi:serine/threonine-protein phosphatase 2A regulatory subunit B'